ncbi:MAG: DUF6089 family protein [Tannerella sp.]|nr:DUF6089 family protein [Tannerella sp.]
MQQRILLATLLASLSPALAAQEYKYEIGGMGGIASYMGDLNKNTPLKDIQPALGGIFRYNPNLRWAVKANLLWGKVSGSTKGLDDLLPDNAQLSFDRNLFELGGQMEFNFFPYSDKYAYKGAKRISPYALAGLGLTVAAGNGSTFASLNIPLGVGVKYKLRHRLNLGCELSVRKLFGDGLEGKAQLNNPYQISENSVWKNRDWYVFLLLSLTWDFGLRCGTCNNSNLP